MIVYIVLHHAPTHLIRNIKYGLLLYYMGTCIYEYYSYFKQVLSSAGCIFICVK